MSKLNCRVIHPKDTRLINNDPIESLISEDHLHKLLKEVLGSKVVIVDQKIVNQDNDYRVLYVRLQHPSIKIVVKLAGVNSSMASSFDRTAMIHRLVAARTTIPVPEILGVNTSFEDWPWRYLIMTHIPGHEWASVQKQLNEKELSDANQQIGKTVAELHSIRFSAFGELAVDGSVLCGGPFRSKFIDRARQSIRDTQLLDVFLTVYEKYKHQFVSINQARLCHEDIHSHNIFFYYRKGRWNLAALLDFDKAWAGHHEIDLARMEFWQGMTGSGFWPAYNAFHPIDPGYLERRPIYQLLWCFEYARSTVQHHEDTQRLCSYFGIGSPEHFV